MISRLKQSNTAGFTLIEALVAITILLLAIAGPMTIASQGLKLSTDAREQMTAFYIAQEGVELVRAIRDTNALESYQGPAAHDWVENIPAACTGAGSGNNLGCGIDVESVSSSGGSPADNKYKNCNNGTQAEECVLFRASGGETVGNGQHGIFTHDSDKGNATIFTRRIRIRPGGQVDEKIIYVIVEWSSRGTPKSLEVYSRLFDQYDYLTPAP